MNDKHRNGVVVMCKYTQECGKKECCEYCDERRYCEYKQCKEVPDTCDGVNQNELQFKKKCNCQEGYYNSGYKGILAHIENGKIASKVERCDECQLFESDEEAESFLKRQLKRDIILKNNINKRSN